MYNSVLMQNLHCGQQLTRVILYMTHGKPQISNIFQRTGITMLHEDTSVKSCLEKITTNLSLFIQVMLIINTKR